MLLAILAVGEVWWWAVVAVDVVWWAVFAIGKGGWCWWVVAVDGGGWLLLPWMGGGWWLLPFAGDIGGPQVGFVGGQVHHWWGVRMGCGCCVWVLVVGCIHGWWGMVMGIRCSRYMVLYPSSTLFTFHYLAFVSHDFFLYLSAVVTCDNASSSIFQTTTMYTLHQEQCRTAFHLEV